MNLQERHDRLRRRDILRLLIEEPGYKSNGSILQVALDALGHRISRDRLRTDLGWLAEQGLVMVTVVGETLHVAELTERGLDVGRGTALADGVARPDPAA